jgi:type VI secretion system ImpH/TssG family protein
MAAANGPAPQHLEYLRNAASVVRRHGLYGLLRAAEARAHGLPKIGESKLPAQNIVDLAQVPILAFPPTTLDSITVSEGRAKVEGYWFGLTGPMGPLPLHLTEFALYERRYSKTRPFGAFLDLLAGRMLQFFYRAWADANPAASADRPATDRFATYLAALTGAADGVRPGAAFPVEARLYYAGLYASRRSAAGLQDAIADLAGAPVTLVEYVPLLRDIERADQTQLGRGFNGLGVDAVAGGRTGTVSDAFRVVVRIDDFRDYEAFMPGGRKFDILAEALDSFAPSHLEWDLELGAGEKAVRPAQLNGRARLGWTSWMNPQAGGGVRADARLGRSARRVARTAARKGAT